MADFHGQESDARAPEKPEEPKKQKRGRGCLSPSPPGYPVAFIPWVARLPEKVLGNVTQGQISGKAANEQSEHPDSFRVAIQELRAFGLHCAVTRVSANSQFADSSMMGHCGLSLPVASSPTAAQCSR
jgi:hypothetical protein